MASLRQLSLFGVLACWNGGCGGKTGSAPMELEVPPETESGAAGDAATDSNAGDAGSVLLQITLPSAVTLGLPEVLIASCNDGGPPDPPGFASSNVRILPPLTGPTTAAVAVPDLPLGTCDVSVVGLTEDGGVECVGRAVSVTRESDASTSTPVTLSCCPYDLTTGACEG